MNDSFDQETLRLLDEAKEVRVDTRRDESAPEHRTIIWVVTVDGAVFVRSVRGPQGRWYREMFSNPMGALHAGDRRIAVHAVPETDEQTIERVSEAYRSKYGRTSPSSTQAMVREETLPTAVTVVISAM
jgi:hypothetical protein